ncbi:TOTE conflict system archaeo-eukaryotic primase domain-containing protein [Rhizobium bangladeshense]|uniref:TOTE conflict system archaeo-eukaryotic primase domain-containing protein n=1 Tax=Rhizobium bangladeshense TaxID=1138189 RepID=UPI001C83099E|nr:hypothetical protein [Rhizobium bangladeshense]MBX4889669.1 hypothetical protein [Rhizobium bangladeshense]
MSLQPTDTADNQSRAYAARLHDLFLGADHRHGLYRVLEVVNGKAEIKDENGKGPLDAKGPPTVALWEMHLASNIRQLGVSPVRADGMSRWGVLDVDDKGVDFQEVVAEVANHKLPVIVCRSKSGRGGHCYLFAADWVPQTEMNAALRALAARLPYKSVDIFPPANSPGNWVCMPYGNGDKTDRYAAKTRGLAMSVAEFLEAAENARQSPMAIAALIRSPAPEGVPASGEDADRAARKLAVSVTEIAEAQEGGRAKLLYGLSKDMGKMIGAGWIEEDAVFDALMEAATRARLPYGEAAGHVRNGIKDGRQQPPDASDGDGGDLYPRIEKLIVRTGGEIIEWRLTLSGYGDITLPVKEIMNYFAFNVHCASQLGAVYRHMKVNDWNERLREARSRAGFEEVPQDETVEYMMREQLRSFCMDRHRGESIDELLLGKPVPLPGEDRVYFRFEDFDKFLRTGSSRFKNGTTQTIGTLIKKAVGKDNYKQTMKIVKGRPKGIPVKWVRMSVLDKPIELPLPPTARPPL